MLRIRDGGFCRPPQRASRGQWTGTRTREVDRFVGGAQSSCRRVHFSCLDTVVPPFAGGPWLVDSSRFKFSSTNATVGAVAFVLSGDYIILPPNTLKGE